MIVNQLFIAIHFFVWSASNFPRFYLFEVVVTPPVRIKSFWDDDWEEWSIVFKFQKPHVTVYIPPSAIALYMSETGVDVSFLRHLEPPF